MIRGGKGGAKTLTGIKFEVRADFLNQVKKLPGYSVDGHAILYKKKEIARSYRKHKLYKFLESQGVSHTKILSKQLLPDEALLVETTRTAYIIEMKTQETSGSVDEKLQTCDFKKKQYKKLFAPLKYKVEYMYVLDDWFKKPAYKDVLNYVESVGCSYYFNTLPLTAISFPKPLKK
jgi:hypothetical protein